MAPYELAKLGVPADPWAAWRLPGWYLARLWYGVLVKRCHSAEDLEKLDKKLDVHQTSGEEEALRAAGFTDAQIALRRRLAGVTDPTERARIRIEEQEKAAKRRPVGR